MAYLKKIKNIKDFRKPKNMDDRYEITFTEGGVDALETILTGGVAKIAEKTLDSITGDDNHGWYC